MDTTEISHVVLVIIILAFSVSLAKLSYPAFFLAALFFAVIFIVNIAAKKLAGYYVRAGVETRILYFQRYGLKDKQYLKYPVPLGVILPLLISIASLGQFFWLAATQSEVRALKSRVSKKHDFYSYSEMTEWHVGIIPAAGIAACLVLAFFAYLIGQSELGKFAIFFACFNMIPLGNIDGSKIFFGSLIMWFVLAAVSIIALGYALLLI